MPNLAYPDENIWKPTLELMKKSIDVAAKNDFSYVNIHIGNASLEKIDLDEHLSIPINDSLVDFSKACEQCCQKTLILDQYAQDRNVLLLVETIPPFDPEHWDTPEGRLAWHATGALSNHIVELLGKDYGIAVTNDLSHTAAECITDDREKLWQYLWERTQALAPYTKLIHANTLRKPFNGTDSHDGITDDDFAQNVFPSKSQLIKLLSLFKHRDDVWIINEPRNHHEDNFFALQAITTSIS